MKIRIGREIRLAVFGTRLGSEFPWIRSGSQMYLKSSSCKLFPCFRFKPGLSHSIFALRMGPGLF